VRVVPIVADSTGEGDDGGGLERGKASWASVIGEVDETGMSSRRVTLLLTRERVDALFELRRTVLGIRVVEVRENLVVRRVLRVNQETPAHGGVPA
jgi:hypothetical protein